MELADLDSRIRAALEKKANAQRLLSSSLCSAVPNQQVQRARSAGGYRESRRDFAVESLVQARVRYSARVKRENKQKYGQSAPIYEETSQAVSEKRALVQRLESMIYQRNLAISALQRRIYEQEVLLQRLGRDCPEK